jgi:hypothetical protein
MPVRAPALPRRPSAIIPSAGWLGRRRPSRGGLEPLQLHHGPRHRPKGAWSSHSARSGHRLMIARISETHIQAVSDLDRPSRQREALCDRCAPTPSPPEDHSQSANLLVRGWDAVADIPAPPTSSQTVKCSLPRRPLEPQGLTAFPLVRAVLVGAGGVEPPAPSVSANHRGTAVLPAVSAGRARPSGSKLSALFAFS